MKILDICVKREFTKNGEAKLCWYKIGSLKIADSGKQYIRLYHQPQTEFFVFDQTAPANEHETETN